MGNKLVIFGAGRIGRSFIAQLFSRAGFATVFVDVSAGLIDELNRRGEYRVINRGDTDDIFLVRNVRCIPASDVEAVAEELAGADIAATAVGQAGLPGVMPLLARGLVRRNEVYPGRALDIIIAENLRNASDYFATGLEKYLPPSFPLHAMAGLIETSIGKMVPIMTGRDLQTDVLQVIAEPYNTLILDKAAFRNPVPSVPGLAPRENMKAWVDRKLFVHNLGHAAAAYLGYLHNPEFVYLYESLEVPSVYDEVRSVMQEAGGALLIKYPGEFTQDSLNDHIDDLLSRFRNKALGDTLFRVGCDLFRKLGPDDRLSGAVRLARETGQPYRNILRVLVCACHFRAVDENGEIFPRDRDFIALYESGLSGILKQVCGFTPEADSDIFSMAAAIERDLFHLAGTFRSRK